MNNPTHIATDIDSEVFYDIVRFLQDNDWKLTLEYDPNIFDKAIDFDFYEFQKGDDVIQMAWDIWCEGEIKALSHHLKMIEKALNCIFIYKHSTHFYQDAVFKKRDLFIRYEN